MCWAARRSSLPVGMSECSALIVPVYSRTAGLLQGRASLCRLIDSQSRQHIKQKAASADQSHAIYESKTNMLTGGLAHVIPMYYTLPRNGLSIVTCTDLVLWFLQVGSCRSRCWGAYLAWRLTTSRRDWPTGSSYIQLFRLFIFLTF